MKPLKILQISTTDLGGGAEGSAWNLFQAYRARGHVSWLAVGTKRSNDPDVFEIPRLRPTVPWAQPCWVIHGRLAPWEGRVRGVCRIRSWLRVLAGGWVEVDRRLGREDFNFPGTRQILSLLPGRPDLVHIHNPHGGYFDLRQLVCLSHQTPVIVNLRDMWMLTGHCAYTIGCQRWKTGCGECPDLNIYPSIERDATKFNWRRKSRIYSQSRLHVTTISQWLMDQVSQSMLTGTEYKLIPNGIDLDVFAPSDQHNARRLLGIPPNASIVLFTAHNPFKDYDVMERAIEALHESNGKELLFICLGKMGKARVLGKGQIIYPGLERDPKRMALYYSAADIFIHAAKDEAFGKTIVEAMACGIPVVATAVGGIPELIEEGATGYLVPIGDTRSMAQRIQQLLDDPSLAQYMGERATAMARQHFGLDRQVDDFLSWYEEILEREDRQHE